MSAILSLGGSTRASRGATELTRCSHCHNTRFKPPFGLNCFLQNKPIYSKTTCRTKKSLARANVRADIVAVRHDLPHMPSLGVSSLDFRPPWQHGGLLFCRGLAHERDGK